MNLTSSNPACDCPVCNAIRAVEGRMALVCEDPAVREAITALGKSLEEDGDIPKGVFVYDKAAADLMIRVATFSALSRGLTVGDVARSARDGMLRAEEASGYTQTHHQQGRA